MIADNNLENYLPLVNAMKDANMIVSYATVSSEVFDFITRKEYCLIVLNVQPPVEQYVEMIHSIREVQILPILIIASALSISDKVTLFHAGVNACLESPLNVEVCMAQVASMIQLYWRAQAENQMPKPIIFGSELIINPIYRQVIIDGELLELTRTEFELLIYLAKHPRQIWSKEQLYHYIWNDDIGVNGDNTVKTHIGNLKKKLSSFGKDYIQNSRGVGYKFVPPVCNS